MRRRLALLALPALAVLVPPAAGAAATAPPVPAPVRQSIAVRAGRVAFVPATAAPGYSYRGWELVGGLLLIRFAQQRAPRRLVVFAAQRFRGACGDPTDARIRFPEAEVWWSRSGRGLEAWRCVGGVKLSASTRPPARLSPLALAGIVASAQRLRRPA